VPGVDTLIQSWDFAFKGATDSDYVAGQVWAKRGAEAFLIYQRWARLSFTETLDAIRDVTRLFPGARRKIVEEKANGSAVIDSLKKEIPGIIPATPTASKEARATAVSPYPRAGNVWLPTMTAAVSHPAVAWDPEGFIAEATSFPRGANDDQVDAASQALAELYLGSGGPASLGAAQGTIPGVRRGRPVQSGGRYPTIAERRGRGR
jgi:predicted phage terminase large subunit-like protein